MQIQIYFTLFKIPKVYWLENLGFLVRMSPTVRHKRKDTVE